MKLSLLLGLARARVDIGRIGGNNSPSAYQPECPPQCVCSKWTCVEEFDFAQLKEKSKIQRLSEDEFDENFRCWKNCCRKSGVQVSTCDRNVCQKCCGSECAEIKSMLQFNRRIPSQQCNSCMEQKCDFAKEYTSITTTRSCRGLFNKYSTGFEGNVTFLVEAERDVRIFLYDKPLSIVRQHGDRRRRDTSDEEIPEELKEFVREQMELNGAAFDVLDEPVRPSTSQVLQTVFRRLRRQVQDTMDAEKLARQEERREARKAERKTARELAKDQKLVFGSINSEEEIEANIKLAEALLEENNAPEEEEPVLLFDDYGGYSEEPEETEEPEFSEYYEEAEFLDEKMRRRAEKEALRKEKRQILKDIKAEQKRLKELSKKWSKVNVALQNPQVVTQAEEVAKDMAMDMGMGASAADFAEEASLSVILQSLGIDAELSEASVTNSYKDFKSSSGKSRDSADWGRANKFHGVNPDHVANLIVKNHLQQAKKCKTCRSVSLLNSRGDSDEMQGLADEEGIDENLLTSGWIQIGLGSANNTACDLKSCQASSYKRCIGVLRKRFSAVLSPEIPQEVNVAISGEGLERVLTVQIGRRGSTEPREKIFEVLIDDPTIAKLQNLAICTTKGARAKLSISKDCCGNEPQGVSSFFTNSRRSEDCKFSCMSTNCRDECMPDTRCDRCLQHNCGTFSTESTF